MQMGREKCNIGGGWGSVAMAWLLEHGDGMGM